MKDEIAYRPLEALTMAELGVLKRVATRYSEIAREHAYLVGLMSLAVRTGDTNLLVTAKRRLAETERQFEECSSALRAVGQKMPNPTSRDGEDELAAAGQTCEYATA
jgi:hypothetical protein